MIRALVAIALLFAAAFLFDLLGDIPIAVTIAMPGGVSAPPLRVVVLGLIVFAAIAILAWKIIAGILNGPGAVRGFFRARRRDKGYTALSRGMIAVGSGDVRLAHRYAGEAGRLLDREPLLLLLEAQTAQLEGKSDAARAAFTRMLDDPDTRLLGLRGLFIEASRAGEVDAARHYAAEAQKLSPGVPWAGTAVLEYQSSEQDWAGALSTLEQSSAARSVDKAEARRLRAVLLTARAMEVEDAEPDRARGYALEAHRLVPDFVPAATVAARVLTRLQDTKKAAKVIEATWKLNPHPDLAEAYLHVRPGDSGRDRLKRARALEAIRPYHIEGVLVVARAALDVRDFDLARQQLAKALREAPTQRVCLMMADLEESEHGDRGRVREWLARAVRAPRDAAWTADGVVAEHWQPASPVTGRLDAFEWRVPVATDSGATELDGSDLAERAVLPLEPPAPPPPPPDEPPPASGESEVKPAAAASEPAPIPAAAQVRPVAAERTAAEPPPVAVQPPPPRPVPAAAPSAGGKPAEYPLPFLPDDPGPVREKSRDPTGTPIAAFS